VRGLTCRCLASLGEERLQCRGDGAHRVLASLAVSRRRAAMANSSGAAKKPIRPTRVTMPEIRRQHRQAGVDVLSGPVACPARHVAD
jgi:hypothetical protein